MVLACCFVKIKNGLKKIAERGTCRLYGEANNLWLILHGGKNMKRKPMMIMAGIFIGICIVVSAGMWYVKTQAFMQTVGSMVAQEATKLLDTEVQIGKIKIDSLHSFTAESVVLYDKEGDVLAETKSAQVKFSLLAMFYESPIKGINEVLIRNPQVTIKKRVDNTWNYEDIISQNKTTKNDFSGKAIIENGTVTGKMDGNSIKLDQVEANLDFAEPSSIKVQTSFKNGAATAEVSGSIGRNRQLLSIQGENFVVEDYMKFLPEGILPDTIKIEAGKIDKIKAEFFKNGNAELHISGQAEFSDGKAVIMQTKVEAIAGLAVFNEKDVSLFASARAAEQKLSVHGKILLNTGDPYLKLVVESQSFDPSKILTNIPFRGAVAFTANLTGTVTDPSVQGEFKANNGEAYGYDFRNAAAKVRFSKNVIFVDDFSAEVFDGRLSGEGEFDTSTLAYKAHVKAENIDASVLKEYVPDFAGRISADVGANGQGADVENLEVYGTADVKNGIYKGVAFNDMKASFYKKGPDVIIDYLSIKLENGGEIGIDGTIRKDSELDLDFYGSHVDMSLVKKFFEQADISGFADFQGECHGSIDNPRIRAEFSATDGMLFKQPYHSLHGSAGGSLDGIGVRDFIMENGDESFTTVHGIVGFTNDKRVDLTVDTKGSRMENVAALLAPNQPLTGNVDNIVHITGTLDNIEAEGYIHFYEGSYRGMLITYADGDYKRKNGITTLYDFHLVSPLIDVQMNGTIDTENNLNLVVTADDIQLDRAGAHLPYPVSGKAKFKGLVSGTVDNPVFEGNLAADSLLFNGQEIKNAHGKLGYRANHLQITSFGFEQNNGKFVMNTMVNLNTSGISGRIDVQNADVNALLAMVNQKNDVLTGRLSGSVDIGGTTTNPQVHLLGSMETGAIKDYALSHIAIDASLTDHVLRIDKFYGEQGSGKLAIQGTAELNGALKARISAQGINAGLLTRLMNLDMDTRGTLDFDAQLGGTIENPSADVSFAVTGGGIGATTFDSLAGLLNLKNGIINVNQVIIQKMANKKNYKISASGFIPLSALKSKPWEMPENYEQINLYVSLDEADMSILPVLSKEVDWAIGPMDGGVRITGTLAHPLFKGDIHLKDGAIKLKSLKNPITNMKMNINFNGDRMTVNDFSGKMGGGVYSLTGSTMITGGGLADYNFALYMKNLGIDCAFYKGPLTGQLIVNEGQLFGKTSPKVTGTILFENAMISIPGIPNSSGDLPRVLLDVKFQLGKKVHFYSPFIGDMQLAGSAHFGGSTNHPQPSGEISVLRGTVNYLKTVFTIREGEAYFNQVDSFFPSIVLRADTKLSQTKVYLAIDGPADNMAIHLASSSGMSETELIQLLTLRSAYKSNGDTSNLNSLLDVGLQMSFLSEVEGMVRNTLNLDEFSVERDTSTNKSADSANSEVYNVKMGKYLTEKFMVRYIQGVGTDTRKIGIQYDINDHISLTADKDQKNAYTVGIEARMSF